MAEWKEYSARTVDEALTNALVDLETTSDKVEYEIVEKETAGLLGLFSKPAVIRVRVHNNDVKEIAIDFLNKVFDAMKLEVTIDLNYDEAESKMDINFSGEEMGILIGKRGITLDSLQYLLGLVVNKGRDNSSYIKIKLDTENYRERRHETLENLAHNLAHKVRRTHRSVYLEPMNPYERRVIHSALQKDQYVETHSEGEEPYRKVVISLKQGVDSGYEKRGRYSYGNNRSYGGKTYNRNGGYRRNNDNYRSGGGYRNFDKNSGNRHYDEQRKFDENGKYEETQTEYNNLSDAE